MLCFAACAQRESSLTSYTTWYPPVQQTLLCLSKLYRCVEPKVFAGLAQDAVSSCALAVQVRIQAPGLHLYMTCTHIYIYRGRVCRHRVYAPI